MTSPGETVLCQYRYDPLDRLISHALPDSPERQRFYCKSRLATEIQGAMRYSIVQHGDQLLAQQRSEGDVTDTTLLATDPQRSVSQTLKADHPRTPIAYSPYGHRSIENGLLSLLGFNGERPDPVTGYYMLGNGYRAFNPVLMRFNSPDNLSPFDEGGLNAYGYCSGDPINSRDPTGHALIFGVFDFADDFFNAIPRSGTFSSRTTTLAPRQASPLLSFEETALALDPRKHQPKTLYQLSRSAVARSAVNPKQILPPSLARGVNPEQILPSSIARDVATESNRQRRIASYAYYNEKPERLTRDIRHEREQYLESIGDYKTRLDEFVDSDFSD
ncbi:RHS repeat-associated core domain-containing protein [Pseudomonas fluorescens]|uniref:RHS repeat-associated core domain-containing protein n=1 Tax=Pseudomonas fluorescens TaxID=294 RepID=A0A5E7DV12_PSEFL|nr:RHS repeat-associated core domain-containing protein [Pseudomonas fluorescens]VVO20401.1 hypothetical protein PS833_04152 [Pseudomonas fluorescens]